ncbi:MAG: PEP-CTERM sorting domain-containing protein [Armatimonadota bacterium]|nr:PEP-CTERM sorting domain-containing protein [Armatimonadota bacterium]
MSTKLYLALAIVSLGASANAAITFIEGGGGIPISETVQFNDPGLILTGPVVTGMGNTTGAIIEFFGAGEDLQAVAAGAARVSGLDGAFTNLSIGLEDPMLAFTGIEINLIALGTGEVTITGHSTKGGTAMATFDVSKNGNNRYSVIATIPDYISFIEISSTVEIGDVRQIRFNAETVVPEPGSFIALGVGVLLLAARRRRHF